MRLIEEVEKSDKIKNLTPYVILQHAYVLFKVPKFYCTRSRINFVRI